MCSGFARMLLLPLSFLILSFITFSPRFILKINVMDLTVTFTERVTVFGASQINTTLLEKYRFEVTLSSSGNFYFRSKAPGPPNSRLRAVLNLATKSLFARKKQNEIKKTCVFQLFALKGQQYWNCVSRFTELC